MILTKTSNPSEIERYFRGILELDKQNKEFSVNLDDVWQLCYAEKGKAVRALKANFIENVDFISIAQNGKQLQADTKRLATISLLPVWSILLLAKYARYSRFTEECSIRLLLAR